MAHSGLRESLTCLQAGLRNSCCSPCSPQLSEFAGRLGDLPTLLLGLPNLAWNWPRPVFLPSHHCLILLVPLSVLSAAPRSPNATKHIYNDLQPRQRNTLRQASSMPENRNATSGQSADRRLTPCPNGAPNTSLSTPPTLPLSINPALWKQSSS